VSTSTGRWCHLVQKIGQVMTDAGFDLTFSVRILNPTRHGHCTVVREHVAIEGISKWDQKCRGRARPRVDCRARRCAWRRPSRRKARSCSSDQMRELERKVSRRTDLRLSGSTCCFLLFVQDIGHAPLSPQASAGANVPDAALVGLFSGDTHWPVLGDR